VLVDRRWSHAERDGAVHIRHHAGSRGRTHGRRIRGVQTFQNQESPVRHNGVNDSCGLGNRRRAKTTTKKQQNKKLMRFRFE